MVNEMPARADEPASGPRPNQNADIVEHDAPGRLANKTRKLKERGPRWRAVQPFAIPRVRCDGRTTATLRIGRTKVGYIPLDRTERVLMIHVYVVESFYLSALSVLNHRAVRAPEIPEAPLTSRLRTLGSHFDDLLLCWESRQCVARHVNQLAVGCVPHLSDFQRSEERRVGKECGSAGGAGHEMGS